VEKQSNAMTETEGAPMDYSIGRASLQVLRKPSQKPGSLNLAGYCRHQEGVI
jgi:hypothetical protein